MGLTTMALRCLLLPYMYHSIKYQKQLADMASLFCRRCPSPISTFTSTVNSRAFSSTTRSNADVKKLGVVGAGQMVSKGHSLTRAL
jgi:hypothetical protein